MGQKVIMKFWWESGLSSASRNYLTTFCRPFVHYACLRLCSAIVHFIRNNFLYFVCYGWSAETSPKHLFGKDEFDVNLWRYQQRTPNTNDTIRHWTNPPMKIFCVRHWSAQTFFAFYTLCIWMLCGKAYAGATKNFFAQLTSTVIFAPLS